MSFCWNLLNTAVWISKHVPCSTCHPGQDHDECSNRVVSVREGESVCMCARDEEWMTTKASVVLPGALTPTLCNIVLFVVLTETQARLCSAPIQQKQSIFTLYTGVYDHEINTKHTLEKVDVSWLWIKKFTYAPTVYHQGIIMPLLDYRTPVWYFCSKSISVL